MSLLFCSLPLVSWGSFCRNHAHWRLVSKVISRTSCFFAQFFKKISASVTSVNWSMLWPSWWTSGNVAHPEHEFHWGRSLNNRELASWKWTITASTHRFLVLWKVWFFDNHVGAQNRQSFPIELEKKQEIVINPDQFIDGHAMTSLKGEDSYQST